jgi:hypothetical protein
MGLMTAELDLIHGIVVMDQLRRPQLSVPDAGKKNNSCKANEDGKGDGNDPGSIGRYVVSAREWSRPWVFVYLEHRRKDRGWA